MLAQSPVPASHDGKRIGIFITRRKQTSSPENEVIVITAPVRSGLPQFTIPTYPICWCDMLCQIRQGLDASGNLGHSPLLIRERLEYSQDNELG
jgi:hypothetical protein